MMMFRHDYLFNHSFNHSFYTSVIQQLADQWRQPFFEASAKTMENVENVINTLCDALIAVKQYLSPHIMVYSCCEVIRSLCAGDLLENQQQADMLLLLLSH
jgi:hypothetical protein